MPGASRIATSIGARLSFRRAWRRAPAARRQCRVVGKVADGAEAGLFGDLAAADEEGEVGTEGLAVGTGGGRAPGEVEAGVRSDAGVEGSPKGVLEDVRGPDPAEAEHEQESEEQDRVRGPPFPQRPGPEGAARPFALGLPAPGLGAVLLVGARVGAAGIGSAGDPRWCPPGGVDRLRPAATRGAAGNSADEGCLRPQGRPSVRVCG